MQLLRKSQRLAVCWRAGRDGIEDIGRGPGVQTLGAEPVAMGLAKMNLARAASAALGRAALISHERSLVIPLSPRTCVAIPRIVTGLVASVLDAPG
jgi:hypothetical protein